MRDFIDKTSTQSGTPINRDNLMALQGFDTLSIRIDGNEIREESDYYGTRIITINDGDITEVFRGKKTIKKITTFWNDEDGNLIGIDEEVVE